MRHVIRAIHLVTMWGALGIDAACRSMAPVPPSFATLPDSVLAPGTGAIVGVIVDARSGKLVSGAGVAIISTEGFSARQAVFLASGRSGRFAIARLSAGSGYRVHCVATGRPSVDIVPVRIRVGMVDSLTCRLPAPVGGPVIPPASDSVAFAVRVSDSGVRIVMPMPRRTRWPMIIPDTVTVGRLAYGWFANWSDQDGISCAVPSIDDARRTESLSAIVQRCHADRHFASEFRFRPVMLTQPDSSLKAVVSGHNVEFRLSRGATWRQLLTQRPDSMQLGVVLSALEATYTRTVRVSYVETR